MDPFPQTRPPTDVTTFQRWKDHILLTLLKETSDAIRLTSAISISLVTRWAVVVPGILLGGNAVYLLQWIATKLMEFSSILSYMIASLMVLIGPTFCPPLTPLTGCESWIHRILFTIGYLVICYMLPKLKLLLQLEGSGFGYAIVSLSSHQILCIMAGVWHMDRGDYNFRWVRNDSQRLVDQSNDDSSGISGELWQCITTYLLLFHFQAAIGIGVCWATFEVYSNAVFFWGIAVYGLVHFFVCAMAYAFGAS